MFGNDELQLDRLRRSWGDCVAQSMSGDFESKSRRCVHRIKGAICPVTALTFFYLASMLGDFVIGTDMELGAALDLQGQSRRTKHSCELKR